MSNDFFRQQGLYGGLAGVLGQSAAASMIQAQQHNYLRQMREDLRKELERDMRVLDNQRRMSARSDSAPMYITDDSGPSVQMYPNRTFRQQLQDELNYWLKDAV